MINQKGVRILLIDDNEAIHSDYKKILTPKKTKRSKRLADLKSDIFGEEVVSEPYDYQIDSAYQGLEALEMVQKSLHVGAPYSVAFVDIRMPPGWDGIETTKRMWQIYPELEIVICSAHSDYTFKEICKQLPQVDQFVILRKPFDPLEVQQLALGLTTKWKNAQKAKLSVTELKKMVEEQTIELRGSNAILVDLNEKIKRNQQQLIQSEKMASIGQLAAGVAHEISNPIGYIKSNLGTLHGYTRIYRNIVEEYEKIDYRVASGTREEFEAISERIRKVGEREDLAAIRDDFEELISETYEGIQRIQGTTQSLLSFAHTDNGELKSADINKCIDTSLKIVWNKLKYKCTVHKNYGSLPEISCNPVQISQVFMNIMINAAGAIKNKGDITINTDTNDAGILVTISDTGTGILKENMSKLFDPFFTTKEVGKGTGLGLSISHEIIKRHKGKITVESQIDKGTTFTISLPINNR